MATKTITIGTLNDESGPAAVIGKPFAVGKRILAEQVNAGGSGLLPEGWKVKLVEKDHGYNPAKAKDAYNELKNDVLFIGTSFGPQIPFRFSPSSPKTRWSHFQRHSHQPWRAVSGHHRLAPLQARSDARS